MDDLKYPHITSPEIRAYCETYSDEEYELLKKLNERSQDTRDPKMISGQFLGRFLSLVSKMLSPKYILELGTFTGYGAMCLAEGLQTDGQLITIEKNLTYKAYADDLFLEAGIQSKITQIIGDAAEVISSLDFVFDLVFIDAAKRQYINYLELVIPKLKSGGIILADNVLWKGKVATSDNDKLGQGLHQFNEYVKNDDRLENIILPIDDGVNMIRKK